MEIGVNGPIFHLPYDKFRPVILTKSWVQHSWEFASSQGILFDEATAEVPSNRRNDRSIMQVIINLPGIRDHELEKFNICRMYLQVFHLSEIVTGDGEYISENAWSGNRSKNKSTSISWPQWGKPKKSYWTIWRRLLRQALIGDTRSRKLQRSLGTWTRNVYPHWSWYLSHNADDTALYHFSGSRWTKHNTISSRITRQGRYYQHGQLLQHPPNTCLLSPTTIITRPNGLIPEGYSPIAFTNPIICPSLLPPHHQLQPSTYKWLFHHVEQSTSIVNLLQAINNGTMLAVSDGSYCPETFKGTAAWTIETQDGSEFITGCSIIPSTTETNSAYSCELGGILAIIHMISWIEKSHNLTGGTVKIGCDGLSALNRSFLFQQDSRTCKEQHSNLLAPILSLLQTLSIRYRAFHVKGHLDNLYAYHSLGRMEQMNIRMDTYAKSLLQQIKSGEIPTPTYSPHPFGIPHIKIDEKIITEDYHNKLYNTLVDKDINAYWIWQKA